MSVTPPPTAKLVRETRQHLRLTQAQFAQLLGVSCQSVNRWENGRSKPLPIVVKQILGLLCSKGESGSELLAKYFSDNFTVS